MCKINDDIATEDRIPQSICSRCCIQMPIFWESTPMWLWRMKLLFAKSENILGPWCNNPLTKHRRPQTCAEASSDCARKLKKVDNYSVVSTTASVCTVSTRPRRASKSRVERKDSRSDHGYDGLVCRRPLSKFVAPDMCKESGRIGRMKCKLLYKAACKA